MPLVVGTLDGILHSEGDRFEPVLDCGDVLAVHTFERHEGVFAATRTGLHRSLDEGASWADLGVPNEEVFSVVASPDGQHLYAGTHPAHLFVSADGGSTWSELDGFQELPSRDQWHTPRHRDASHVRDLAVHPDEPRRIVAGVEVGGVHVSDDRGETWTQRRAGLEDLRDDDLQYDVHHLSMTGPETVYVSCGGGFFRTRDAGRTWNRLDAPLEQSYFHASAEAAGRLYVAGETIPPGPYRDGGAVDGGLFESPDGGDTLDPVAYPGGPQEVVTAFEGDGDRLLAGTSQGRLLAREDGDWIELGEIPGWVRTIARV